MSDKVLSHFESLRDFEDCLELAERSAVTSTEMKFVDSLKEKFETYDADMFLSGKQADWLKRIAKFEE